MIREYLHMPGFRGLYQEGDFLIGMSGGRMVEINLVNHEVRRSCRWAGKWNSILLHDPWSRTMRGGLHHLCKGSDEYVGISKQGVILFNQQLKKVKEIKKFFNGSRPLGIVYHPVWKKFYFGEYFQNSLREKVNIYSSTNGIDWEAVYVFPSGSIRHVHNVQYDYIRGGIWVSTGDTDAESAIYYTSDGFETLELISGGSQASRIVSLIPLDDHLILPSDTPSERNFIREFNFDTEKLTEIISIPNSAMYAGKSSAGLYFITTFAEPSKINDTQTASLYLSQDGRSWQLFQQYEKDLWSSISFRLFGYPLIQPIQGVGESRFFCAYMRGLKGISDGTKVFTAVT